MENAGSVKAQVGKAKKQACIYSYANNDDYMLGIADRLDILEVILPILFPNITCPLQMNSFISRIII